MIHLLHPPSLNDETRRKTLCGKFIDATSTATEDRAYVEPGPDVRMCEACRGGRTSGGHGLKRLAVFAVRQSKGQTIWVRAGIAYQNKDDSLEVHLDVLPIDGKLHLRDAQGEPQPSAPRPRPSPTSAPSSGEED